MRDFAWWSSLTLTQARRGLAAVAHELETLTVDGVEYWHRPGLEPAAAGVAALPAFDEFLLGYQDRSAQLDPEWMQRVVPGGNGIFMPILVADGHVVGLWKKAATAKKVTVTSPLAAPFERYGRFLGLPVEVVS